MLLKSQTVFFLPCSVLMLQMRHYNKPVEETGRLEEIQDQVDELKDIMVKNIGELTVMLITVNSLYFLQI